MELKKLANLIRARDQKEWDKTVVISGKTEGLGMSSLCMLMGVNEWQH